MPAIDMAIVYLNYIPIDLFPKRINKVKLAFFFYLNRSCLKMFLEVGKLAKTDFEGKWTIFTAES